MQIENLLLILGLLYPILPISKEEEGFDLTPGELETEDVTAGESNENGLKIGSDCEGICTSDIAHIFCNKATNKCECDHTHPIKLNDHVCLAPIRLGEVCNHQETCTFFDRNAECMQITDYYYKCSCKKQFQQVSSNGHFDKCIPVKKEMANKTDVPTVLGVGLGMGLFTGLTCLVLRLFSNARFSQPRGHFADANLPPPITLTSTPSSAPPSRRSSGRSTGTPGSRRQSYTMLAPPSRSGSRRPSSSSLRSQMSVRSCTSGRGERVHEVLRPTVSAPTPETGSPYRTPNRSEQRIPIYNDALSEEKEEVHPPSQVLYLENEDAEVKKLTNKEIQF